MSRHDLRLELAEHWSSRLAVHWPTWEALPAELRESVAAQVPAFVDRRRWEAVDGMHLTAERVALIAAQACLLTAGRLADTNEDRYARVGPIIVHPAVVALRGQHHLGTDGLASDSTQYLDGRAEFRGPVVLVWPAVANDARRPYHARNVVAHEFAHQLDMDDGALNGTPAGLPDRLRRRWQRVCSAEFESIRRGNRHALRAYAGTDVGEFFAVATETFISSPSGLADGHLALYELLCRYYGFDPASWSW